MRLSHGPAGAVCLATDWNQIVTLYYIVTLCDKL